MPIERYICDPYYRSWYKFLMISFWKRI